jgi:hypothetical protein
MRAIDAFLDGIIDYAGLYPPADLDLPTALSNYAAYRRHPEARALGRFVLPLERLDAPVVAAHTPERATLIAKGAGVVLPELPDWVESVEISGSLDGVEPERVLVFQEIDWRGDFNARMEELKRGPMRGVKLRTGGLSREVIPPVKVVAEFLIAAARHRLPVRFTAGLHVPVPNDDPHSGGRAHGFLNVFAAAFLAYRHAASTEILADMLADASYPDFRFDATEYRCGGYAFAVEEIRELRLKFVLGFGSSSFLEPIEHLKHHGML